MGGGFFSTQTLVAVEFVVLFGGLMWFAWRSAKSMERQVAEDRRRAAEKAETGATATDRAA